MMTNEEINAAMDRANRALDGMKYNRDAMAMDVKHLVALVLALQEQNKRLMLKLSEVNIVDEMLNSLGKR